MFYDHELGEAGYRSPSGEIKGVISLKRQYRIRGGKMEFMIESALTVHDDILQKELSSNAKCRYASGAKSEYSSVCPFRILNIPGLFVHLKKSL